MALQLGSEVKIVTVRGVAMYCPVSRDFSEVTVVKVRLSATKLPS